MKRPELKVTRKDGSSFVVPVTGLACSIGRRECDLNLEDTAISRRHCEIAVAGDGWVVRDLRSSNGTFIGGERVTERVLQPGEIIRIGQSEILFTMTEAPDLPEGGPAEAGGVPPSRVPLAEDTAVWNILELSVAAGEARTWQRNYLETIVKRLRAERGCFLSVDPVTGAVMPAVSIAMEFVEAGPEGSVPFSRSIVDQAVSERRVIATTNAEVDPRFRDAVSVAKYDIRTVLCAPARWQGVPVGAVYLERLLTKDPFGEEDSQHLQDLADLLGIATMAWQAQQAGSKDGWEREQLLRTFPETEVTALLARGGASAIRRHGREVCHVAIAFSKTADLIAGVNEEAWRLVSQLYAQANDILLRHGGAVSPGLAAHFGALEGPGVDAALNAVRAAVEIQKTARPVVKRFARDMKLSFGVGIGVSLGESLAGWFGSGPRTDFLALGEPSAVARGLALQAEDGEVLADQAVFGKVRLHFNTHRLAPVTLPGVARQVPVFRIVAI